MAALLSPTERLAETVGQPASDEPSLWQSIELTNIDSLLSEEGFDQASTVQKVNEKDKSLREGSTTLSPKADQSASTRYHCKCGKSYARPGGLQRHKRNCLTSDKLCCSDCGHSFAKSENLARHKHIHSGRKDYQCGQCQRRFNRKDNCLQHERRHPRPSSDTSIAAEAIRLPSELVVILQINQGIQGNGEPDSRELFRYRVEIK